VLRWAIYRHAAALHGEVLALRKRGLDTDHSHVTMIMNNLANAYAALGHFRQAVALHGEDLALRKRVTETSPYEHEQPSCILCCAGHAGSRWAHWTVARSARRQGHRKYRPAESAYCPTRVIPNMGTCTHSGGCLELNHWSCCGCTDYAATCGGIPPLGPLGTGVKGTT
jgi:hypothetical protein